MAKGVDLLRLVRIWIWGPLSIVTAFLPLLVLHSMQLPTVVLLPFNKPLFRRLNTAIAGAIWTIWGVGLQKINGTRLEIQGDPLPMREDAIVICNHQQMGDIVVLMALATPVKSVRHMKWLVKDIVKYVPGVGWGLLFLDCVFLKRNWTRDEKKIRRVFSEIATHRLPVWLSSFPEGTRATSEKLRRNQEVAKKRGIEALKHLLIPKTKGFAASVISLRHHVKAVYSVTIGYVGGVPTLVGMIRGDCRRIAVNIKRIPIEALPEKEAELSQWLIEEFRHKDQIFDQFVTQLGCGTAAKSQLLDLDAAKV